MFSVALPDAVRAVLGRARASTVDYETSVGFLWFVGRVNWGLAVVGWGWGRAAAHAPCVHPALTPTPPGTPTLHPTPPHPAVTP